MPAFFRKPILHLLSLIILSSCLRNDEKPADTLFDINGIIQHDSETRTYQVHLPSAYYTNPDAKLPLLMGFHGGLGSAENFKNQSGLNTKADQENFIVVY